MKKIYKRIRNFADLLREVFTEYAKSEEYYQRVIRRRGDNAGAWMGLAILNQQWAELEDAPSEITSWLTYAIHRAKELLRSQFGKGEQLQTLLSLADLQIEIRDWPEARQSLALAASVCGESRLKRADIDSPDWGVVCHWSEEHTPAVKHLRQALIVNPGSNFTQEFGNGPAAIEAIQSRPGRVCPRAEECSNAYRCSTWSSGGLHRIGRRWRLWTNIV